MKKLIALGVTLILTIGSHAQKPVYLFQGYPGSGDDLDPKKLHKWTSLKLSAYTGIYHFGESEGEWDLLVMADDSGLVLQSFSNDWGKVDGHAGETWRKSIKVYRNAKITNNKFAADSLTGFFMVYDLSKGQLKGIILPYNPDKIDTAEFGAKQDDTIHDFWFFKGDYPELSYKILEDDYFKTRSPEQLQIMRNEIYARYGQRFAKTGKMYAHFIKKEWYQPFRDNVQSYLTDIELKNIEKIKSFEK